MPTSSVSRTIPAAPQAVWALVGDARQLPRWWPRTVRVEDVRGRGFTLVLESKRGREVRADQVVIVEDRMRRRVWALEVEGTPFAAVFAASETEVGLAPADGGATEVTLELRQRLKGTNRLGGFLVRRSGRKQLRAALDALERELARPN